MRALGVALLLCACSPPLDAGFTGTWDGLQRLALASGEIDGPAEYTVTATGDTAVTVICGTTFIRATGSADSASWVGTASCPPVETPGCDSTTLTYTKAQLQLDAQIFYYLGSGTAAGCGTVAPASVSFRGEK